MISEEEHPGVMQNLKSAVAEICRKQVKLNYMACFSLRAPR